MNVRTLFRGDLYTIAALDGHTRDHLEVRGLRTMLLHPGTHGRVVDASRWGFVTVKAWVAGMGELSLQTSYVGPPTCHVAALHLLDMDSVWSASRCAGR